jgi:glycosyltransferase involved in cell wall biosynthesis
MNLAQDTPLLSVVMPCLDEAATVAACVREARAAIDRLGVAGEIVVGDNGSRDGSPEAARAAGARVVPVGERGYGACLRGAVEATRGRYVVMGDADRSYDFGDLHALFDRLQAGDDLVIGNRFRGRIDAGAMPWLHERLGNPVLSWLGRRLFGSGLGDFQCGLRGVSREAWDRLGLRSPGMELATEMIARALQMGLRVSEVPVTLRRDGRGRRSHLRPVRDGLRHLWLMARLVTRG